MPESEPTVAPVDTAGLDADPECLLTPQAQRALAEADERRITRDAAETARAKELGGRKGPDPVRYGDWEVGGIASDF